MPKSDDARKYGSVEEFRQAARDASEPVADARVRASFDTEVKAGEGDSRTLTFTISNAAVDRMGDTIAVAGWKFDSFRKNPVVLWGHDAADFPVAKAGKLWIEGENVKAEAEFVPKENPATGQHAEGVLQLYKGGFLSAVSVGFIPLKYAFTEDPKRRFGIDFIEQELLEFSCVTVPANAEALIEGRAAGIDVTPMLDWCELQIKRCGDNSRIIKLAEGVLGSKGDDLVALSWAERIVLASGKKIADRDEVVMSRGRLEAVERAAKNKRLTEKRQREVDALRIR